jgi:hypothetical protein
MTLMHGKLLDALTTLQPRKGEFITVRAIRLHCPGALSLLIANLVDVTFTVWTG